MVRHIAICSRLVIASVSTCGASATWTGFDHGGIETARLSPQDECAESPEESDDHDRHCDHVRNNVELVRAEGNDPDGGKWLDLLMLALFAGRERNEEQWRSLLDAEGFQVEQIRDGVIEARCL